jgi:hypothetical protein
LAISTKREYKNEISNGFIARSLKNWTATRLYRRSENVEKEWDWKRIKVSLLALTKPVELKGSPVKM